MDQQREVLKTSGIPDTYWIKEWDRALPYRELAVIQAGINRTWLAACHAEFPKFAERWSKAREDIQADIDFVRAPSTTFYEGAARLKKLWTELDVIAKKRKLYLPRAHSLNLSYLWADLVALEGELAKRTARHGFQRRIAPNWAFEKTHIAPTDIEDQRLAYCWSASTTGTPTLGALPLERDYAHSKGKSFIRHVYSKDEEKQLKTWLSTSNVKNQEKAPGVLHLPDLGNDAKPKTLHYVAYNGFGADFEVTSVKEKAGKTSLNMAWKYQGEQRYNCKTSNELQRIDSDGTLLYRVDCKTRPTTFDLKIVAEFDDLPAGVIKKGDKVGFYAELTAFKLKQNSKKTTTKVTAKVRGIHLREVRRGSETILKY